MNVMQIFGQIGMGMLSDHYRPHIPMFVSTFLSAVSVLVFWGLSKSLSSLIVFAIFYGCFAGGYSVLYARFATELTKERGTGLWLYSVFEFQRGMGTVIGGSLSGLLTGPALNIAGYGLIKYEGLILLVGVSNLISSFGGIGWFFRDQCFHFTCLFYKYVVKKYMIPAYRQRFGTESR